MKEWLVFAAAVLGVCSACHCESDPLVGEDGGREADGGEIAPALWWTDGGGGPRCSGPFDAGELREGELPFAELCETLRQGIVGQLRQERIACSEPLSESDLAQLVSADRAGPTFSCSPDGGVLGAQVALFARSIDGGRMAYDARKAFACRELGRVSGGCAQTMGEGKGPIEPCASVLVGLVEEGGGCEQSEECIAGAYCRPDSSTGCGGTCVKRLAWRSRCNPDRELCAAESSCRGGDGGYSCVPFKAEGESCSLPADCRSGLACAGGRCVVPGGLDASCEDTLTHRDCAPDLGCMIWGNATRCRPRARLGERCSETPNIFPPCQDSPCIKCDPAAAICVPRAMVGAPCLRGGDECGLTFFCSAGGRCELKPRRGERCDPEEGKQDEGNCLYPDDYCREATEASSPQCTQLPRLGEPCQQRCAEGFCFDSACRPLPRINELCGADAGLASDCASADLYCDPLSRACRPLPSAGSACTPAPSSKCDQSAYCDRQQLPGTCFARKPEGAPCTESEQCVTGLCDRVSRLCAQRCSGNFDNRGASCQVGCPNGARDLSFFLLFAAALWRPRKGSARSR